MRRTVGAAVLLIAACTPVACTRSAPTPAPTVTRTRVVDRGPAVIPTTPVVAGPTSSSVRDCPLVPLAVVMPIIGQRLDHATVQTSGGSTIGCTFFPITTGLAASEHLPKRGFASAQIKVATYPSAESARQVLALVSRAGRSPSLQSINGLVGETFQTRFYPPDGDADWACAFIRGRQLITVLTAESSSQGQPDVVALSQALTLRD